jgi:3-deoxy-manno-octulosonate cytidylyltransferase (CMP-KDO synthetase)
MSIKSAIIIPARYGSTRLPGKPLAVIAGQTLLKRVVAIAKESVKNGLDAKIIVATDDERIVQHCNTLNVESMMTPVSCETGTDRVAYVVAQMAKQPDFIINLQGDAPLTPPSFITKMIQSFEGSPCDVITTVEHLKWDKLDRLRENKKTTPFSGSTATFDQKTGRAFWFSKTIIPAIRGEEKMRLQDAYSPVYRHIGLYGYSTKALKAFVSLPVGYYEALEGLEQLRFIENNYYIRCIEVDYQGHASMSGVDSPEDIIRCEELIRLHGEMLRHD